MTRPRPTVAGSHPRARLRWAAGLAALVAGLPLASAAGAQPAQAQPITLTPAADDGASDGARHISLTIDQSGEVPEGDRVMANLRARFGATQLFRVVDDGQPAGFHLHLSAVKGDGPTADVVSFAVVLTMTDLAAAAEDRNTPLENYLASTVGVCGKDVLEQCADNIYATFGSEIRDTSDGLAAAMQSMHAQAVQTAQ